jgi:hypothetical protein
VWSWQILVMFMGVLLNPNVKHENSNLQKKLLFWFSWIPSKFLSALRVRQRGLVFNKSQYNSFCGRWIMHNMRL